MGFISKSFDAGRPVGISLFMVFYSQQNSYVLGNIPITMADRLPCPVCGHATGDCCGDSIKPTHIIGYNQIDSLSEKQNFLVEEDIYEDKQLSQFITTRVLLHPKGKQIPLSEAKKLGLI